MFNNNWKIEIRESGKSHLISIEEFAGSENVPDEEIALHLLKSKEK